MKFEDAIKVNGKATLGCGAVCPHGVIEMKDGVVVAVNLSKCTGWEPCIEEKGTLRCLQYTVSAASLGIRHPGNEFVYKEKDVKESLKELMDYFLSDELTHWQKKEHGKKKAEEIFGEDLI